jgi:hypothetical protein
MSPFFYLPLRKFLRRQRVEHRNHCPGQRALRQIGGLRRVGRWRIWRRRRNDGDRRDELAKLYPSRVGWRPPSCVAVDLDPADVDGDRAVDVLGGDRQGDESIATDSLRLDLTNGRGDANDRRQRRTFLPARRDHEGHDHER